MSLKHCKAKVGLMRKNCSHGSSVSLGADPRRAPRPDPRAGPRPDPRPKISGPHGPDIFGLGSGLGARLGSAPWLTLFLVCNFSSLLRPLPCSVFHPLHTLPPTNQYTPHPATHRCAGPASLHPSLSNPILMGLLPTHLPPQLPPHLLRSPSSSSPLCLQSLTPSLLLTTHLPLHLTLTPPLSPSSPHSPL